MKSILETTLSALLCGAALMIGIATVHREFWPPTVAPQGLNPNAPPEFVEQWVDFKPASIAVGDTTAPITIVEIADFQCPFCSKYFETLRHIQDRYQGRVSRRFVHWPLNIHPMARPAARAAECAYAQGAFESMEKTLYAGQSAFGARPWRDYAREAGVRDLDQFEKCSSATTPISRIDEGVRLARQFGLGGTPTVLVNGWKFVGGPTEPALTDAIDRLLAGKTPKNAKAAK